MLFLGMSADYCNHVSLLLMVGIVLTCSDKREGKRRRDRVRERDEERERES